MAELQVHAHPVGGECSSCKRDAESLRAALREAEAQLERERMESADYAQMAEAVLVAERGRAEALVAALDRAWERWHRNCTDGGPVKERCRQGFCAEFARDLAGEPREAIDGDAGLTIEQQAEEAQSQAEYAKRAEAASSG